jgi:hypothetical protein
MNQGVMQATSIGVLLRLAFICVSLGHCGQPKSNGEGNAVYLEVNLKPWMKDMSFRLNGVAPEPNSGGAHFVLCTLERSEFQNPKLTLSVTENGKTEDVVIARSTRIREADIRYEQISLELERKNGKLIEQHFPDDVKEAHSHICSVHPWKQ